MDSAGFVLLEDVLRHFGWSRAVLDDLVADNNKDHIQIDGDRIHAVQGHSLASTPVTLEGLEGSWERVLDDAPLFHGTSVDAAERRSGEDSGRLRMGSPV